jgi:hypothetical protein
VTITNLAEAVKLLRAQGQDDDAIARDFAASGFPVPEGHHHWQRVAVRQVCDEDAHGAPLDGNARRR